MINLTPRQIVEAFPSEARHYVPIYLKQLKQELKPWLQAEYDIQHAPWDQCAKMINLEILNIMKPKKKYSHYETLKAMERIMSDKPIDSNKMVSAEQIAKAKEVSIILLHPFKKVKMSSGKFAACCPFTNEKTPSFFVYPDNHYHCFGACGKHGDAINFIMELKDLDFTQAVRFLCDQRI